MKKFYVQSPEMYHFSAFGLSYSALGVLKYTSFKMRSKFDNGEDLLDPEQQYGGGGHGRFPHGFPFGGGGFTFKFNF
uniref:Uncharacterized protein n=1 Tax=Amphimedon queenslandica TaxID=400682 RepID=A0A1X7TDR7_AMPQE